MSEVCASRYLAGLASNPRVVEKPALVPMPLNGVEAYPVRTWLSS